MRMIKEIKNIFRLFFILISSAIITYSCESEPDQLGMQFFQSGTAEGIEKAFDVTAYNVFQNDTIEADNNRLTEATLGAFDEPNFGMQKSSYVTQVRLASYDPDFGVNPVVDSVVLQMKPSYYTISDSVKIITYEDYTYTDNVAAKKVITTYPIKKYGKEKINNLPTTFTVNVEEVNDFLYSIETDYKSDHQVTVGNTLGSKTFDGNLRAIKITKDADNSELFSKEAGLRIPLDKTFFQNKIINKKGSFELKDAASFIRYFKGIRISVSENDGYIFNFNPNEITATIYYNHDKSTTDNTKVAATYNLDFGSANVHFNQIKYNRSAIFTTNVPSTPNVNGDKKLFLQGMGGPGAEILIPDATIAELKSLYNTEKIGILSAKIRLYTDSSIWTKTYAKPNNFVLLTKDTAKTPTYYDFLKDMTAFQYSGIYKMINTGDLDKNPAYYELGITQSLKNIIEEKEANKPFVIHVGTFQTNSTTGSLLGKNYTTRAYTPNRIVLVGSDPSNTQYKAQLKVIYSKK